jgi:hypothetical protein
MKLTLRIRRLIAATAFLVVTATILATHPDLQQVQQPPATQTVQMPTGQANDLLEQLAVKGRAPKTGYTRDQFGGGWGEMGMCDTRNVILHRDLVDVVVDEECHVTRGTLHDPYTGKAIAFMRGDTTSQAVQIDHVVALSNAWQTGAQLITPLEREQFANDPLELLAVDGEANQQKSDGDAATWLPPNKAFRCQYVARQIAVKAKYQLWVTPAEKSAMQQVLATCPGQLLPVADATAR